MTNSDINRKKISRLAIASLLLSLAFPFGLILAIIFIFVIVKNRYKIKGLDHAIVAIVLSLCFFVFFSFIAIPLKEDHDERG